MDLRVYYERSGLVEVFSCLEVGPQCHSHARTCENTDDSIPNSLGKADLCLTEQSFQGENELWKSAGV